MSRFAMSMFATKEDRAEAMGYDAGRNMPNVENCNFSAFGTPPMAERCKEWLDANGMPNVSGEYPGNLVQPA